MTSIIINNHLLRKSFYKISTPSNWDSASSWIWYHFLGTVSNPYWHWRIAFLRKTHQSVLIWIIFQISILWFCYVIKLYWWVPNSRPIPKKLNYWNTCEGNIQVHWVMIENRGGGWMDENSPSFPYVNPYNITEITTINICSLWKVFRWTTNIRMVFSFTSLHGIFYRIVNAFSSLRLKMCLISPQCGMWNLIC